jgi:hypothetical protein
MQNVNFFQPQAEHTYDFTLLDGDLKPLISRVLKTRWEVCGLQYSHPIVILSLASSYKDEDSYFDALWNVSQPGQPAGIWLKPFLRYIPTGVTRN